MKLRSIIAAALAAVLGGCAADNNASLQWGPICFPTETCTFSETCDAQYIGLIELQTAATQLWLFAQVNNQRPSTEVLDIGQLDTATAFIRELVIENDVTPVTVTVPVAFTVPTSGTGVISLPIPNALGGTVAGQVTYQVRARGVWGDETSFETAALEVGVVVCDSCGTTCATGGCPVASGQSPIACGS